MLNNIISNIYFIFIFHIGAKEDRAVAESHFWLKTIQQSTTITTILVARNKFLKLVLKYTTNTVSTLDTGGTAGQNTVYSLDQVEG